MSTILFREIGPGDYSMLSRFLEANDVPAVVRTFDAFPMTGETARTIALEARKDKYYGAVDGGELVGLSMLRGWDEGYAIPSFGIVIDHHHHGLGIGGCMLDFTIARAIELGAPRIRLTVYATNLAGIHLYASRGFVESGRERIVVAGEETDKILMFRNGDCHVEE